MLLDVDNAIPYLLERRYLSPTDIVDGSVRVTSVSRRNRNLRIVRNAGAGLLVKQVEASGSESSLANEASFYRHCQDDPRAAPVRALIPALVGFEDAEGALLIELVADAMPLGAHRGMFDDAAFLARVGAAVGRALGAFHRSCRSLVGTPGAHTARLGRNAPWVLWVHRPGPEILAEISAANMKTLRILQQRVELARQLDALRRSWRIETAVHCDIKADNLLLVGDVAGTGAIDVRVVDWELVQLGDPGWDVGAMFKDFVMHWILSMPISKQMTSARMMDAAIHPLTGFQAGLRALWRAYQGASELHATESNDLLLRSSGYAAAWLVQSAYESAQRASELGNHEVMMLQVAANVLADPAEAALRLFGVPMQAVLR
ncbi:MAG: phosphotransferase [Deltaproteobacteria bacterium]|nr:phosphotransferase [Nannocystaceae bacterium]